MPREKLAMEGKRCRLKSFRNREKGLKKKMHELCTLCDVQGCMIIYGADGDGPSSSRPSFWPENCSEVESIIDKYMKLKKEDQEKRTLNLSDVYVRQKRRPDLELPKLKAKKAENKGWALDELSYEELMEMISKLDMKLEEVENMIDSKKRENNLVKETTVHWSDMPGLCTIQPLDVPLLMGMMEEDIRGLMMNTKGLMEADDLDSAINPTGLIDDDLAFLKDPMFY